MHSSRSTPTRLQSLNLWDQARCAVIGRAHEGTDQMLDALSIGF